MKNIYMLIFCCFSLCSFGQFAPGNIDLNFNGGDVGFGQGDGFTGTINNVIALPDGKVLVTGANFFNSVNTTRNLNRINANGTIDNTFNTGNNGPGTNVVSAMVRQSDGKILIAGAFLTYNGLTVNKVARLNADGSLDNLFNVALAPNSNPTCIAYQADGKVLIGGNFTNYNNIVRFNVNGSVDATFTIPVNPNASVNSIAVQADGKIIVGGDFTNYNGTGRNRLIRLNSDGTLDMGFNGTGNGAAGAVNSIAIRSDGKIWVGGAFTQINGINRGRIALIDSDGNVDNSFTTLGSGLSGVVNKIVIQPDNKIILAGGFTWYGTIATPLLRIGRFNVDGSIDNTFNSGEGVSGTLSDISLNFDGKIYVGGQPNGTYNLIGFGGLCRINADGSFDQTFNPTTGSNKNVRVIVPLADGRLLIGGNFNNFNGTGCGGIIRLLPDGTTDPSFITGALGGNQQVNSIKVQTDGKILVGGNFNSYLGVARNNIMRLNTDGSLDAGFNPGTGPNNQVQVVAISPTGQIYIGGNFNSYNGASNLINKIARLNNDGTRDVTFAPGTGVSGVGTGAGNNTGQPINAIDFQSDGKIIIGGTFPNYNGSTNNNLARLNTNGSHDTGFNSSGVGSNGTNSITTLKVLPDDKIVIAGNFTTYNGTSRGRVARINSNGTLDTGFDTPSGGAFAAINSISVQQDGKVIIGGGFTNYASASPTRVRLARLNSNGTIDATFLTNSGLGNGANSGSVLATAITESGKIYAGGDFTAYSGTGRNRLVRVYGQTIPQWTGNSSPDWNTPGNWSTGQIPLEKIDAIIPNVSPNPFPIITGINPQLEILQIATNASVQILPNASLSVTEYLNNSGTMTVESGGSLVQTTYSNLAETGNFIVKRQGNTSATHFNFWSTPVDNISVNVLGATRYWFNPATSTVSIDDNNNDPGWTVASGTMISGRGYASTGSNLVTFNGMINNHNILNPLEFQINKATVSDGEVGMNLIGNPFPSAIRIVDFLTDNESVINGSVYFWNQQFGPPYTSNDYTIVNNIGAVSGGPSTPNSTTIPSGQGFVVVKTNSGLGNVEFKNSQRIAGNNTHFYDVDDIAKLWLSVTSPQMKYNETLIAFKEDATEGYDNLYDSKKLSGNNFAIALHSYIDDEKFAIQTLPNLQQANAIQLGLLSNEIGNFTISLKNMEQFNPGTIIVLEDTKFNHFHNLIVNNQYVYEKTANDIEKRFRLHFYAPPIVASIAACEYNSGKININNPSTQQWNVSLEDEAAQIHGQGILNGISTLEFENLSSGLYKLIFTGSDGIQFENFEFINANEIVDAAFTLSNNQIVLVPFETITAEANHSSNNVNYEWFLNDLQIGTGSSVSFAVSEIGTYSLRLEAKLGDCIFSTFHSINVESTTSINNLEIDNLKAYPNPANEMVTLVWNDRTVNYETARIVDISGRTVQMTQLSGRIQGNQLQLDLRDVSEGMYLISLESNEVRKTVKISVVR